MIMTNEQMEQAINVLTELNETGRLGYAIARNLRKLKEETTEYRQFREEAIRKHGVETPQGDGTSRFSVPKENLGDYISEMLPIAKIEHDVDIWQVPEDVFILGTMNSKQMEQLLWMVEGM